jgi:hypothetical protein
LWNNKERLGAMNYDPPPPSGPTLQKTESFQMADLMSNLPDKEKKRRRRSSGNVSGLSAEDAKALAEELGAPPPAEPSFAGRQNSLMMPGDSAGLSRLDSFHGFDNTASNRNLSDKGKEILSGLGMGTKASGRPDKKKTKHQKSRSDSFLALQKQRSSDMFGDLSGIEPPPPGPPSFGKKTSLDFGLSMDAGGVSPSGFLAKDMSLDLGPYGVDEPPPAQNPSLGRAGSMSLDLGGILNNSATDELGAPPSRPPSFASKQSSLDLGSFMNSTPLHSGLERTTSTMSNSNFMVRGVSMDLGEAPPSLPFMSEQSMDALASMTDL